MKNLANYALQPVMVFMALAVFNVFVISAIYTMLNFKVCIFCIFSFLNLFCLVPTFPRVYGGGLDFPTGVFMVLIFIIITNAMLKISDHMAKFIAEVTTGTSSTSLAKTAESTIKNSVDWFGSFMNTITLTKYGKQKDKFKNTLKELNKTRPLRVARAPLNAAKSLFE